MKISLKVRIGVSFLIILAAMSIIAIPSYAETIWEKRQKSLQDVQETEKAKETVTETDREETLPSQSASIDPFSITIPEQYGTIIDSYKGTNGNLIVHVQDAHANYEAQKNIVGILESLIRDYNLRLILEEGGSTDASFRYLRIDAPLEARVRASEKLLKNAKITGLDYLELTTDYPLTCQGIEDKALYNENRNAIWEMDKFKGAALEYVNKISTPINSLKEKIYNADLLSMDKAKKDYENEAMDIVSYYKTLYGLTQKKNIPIGEFPNFTTLMKIDELEKKFDLIKIRNNTANNEEKAAYDEYQALLKKLNVNKLFKEEGILEDRIEEFIAENTDQKNLYKISKAISILDKMLNVKVVPEEWTYFLENKKDFDPNLWVNFLKEKTSELGTALDLPSNSYAITDNLSKIEKVYITAGERDKVFLRKSGERIKKDGVQIAALIAGGFHTPTLTRLLADSDYSYVVISPKVTTPTDDKLYRESLKGEWLPE